VSEILLVDDDADIREALAILLRDADHGVREAANGREALSLLEEGFRPSLIVLDLMMPVMNGWQFLEARGQRRDLASIPVVVLTAAALDDKLHGLGVSGLRKPVNPDALLAAISKHLAS